MKYYQATLKAYDHKSSWKRFSNASFKWNGIMDQEEYLECRNENRLLKFCVVFVITAFLFRYVEAYMHRNSSIQSTMFLYKMQYVKQQTMLVHNLGGEQKKIFQVYHLKHMYNIYTQTHTYICVMIPSFHKLKRFQFN